MRRITGGIVLFLVALVTAPGFASAAAPPGQVGIKLLEAPVDRANDPRAAGAIIDHLRPGTTIRRKIEVSSGLDKPIRLSLYAAGAEVRGATFRFFDGRTANDLAGWVTVDRPAVDLAPRSSATATVTVVIPRDAVAGERYAVVWAELPAAQGAGGFAVVNRVGIRLYLSVGSGGEPPTDFVIDSLTPGRSAAGRPTVTAAVRNTGRRALDLGGELRLGEGPGGLSAGPFTVRPGTTIGIGAKGDVVTELDPAIPAGPWMAAMTLRSGLVERSASARLRFPAAAGSSGPRLRPHGRSLLPLLGALLLLIGVAWWLFLFLRRRHEERREDQSPRTEVIPIESRQALRRPAAGPYARQAAASKEHGSRSRTGGNSGRRR